jgi:hypothetical protein
MSPVDQELVDLYAAESPGLSPVIIAAFIDAGMEPPTAQSVTERGLSAQDNAVINAYKEKHDPYGVKAETAKYKAEGVE